MKKRKNKKRSFTAYRRSNNTFQIKNIEGILKPGQKILISQETDEPIVHFNTGKEIGKVEIKLGVGRVTERSGQNGTVIVQVGSGRTGMTPNVSVNDNSVVARSPRQMRRVTPIKGVTTTKSFSRKKPVGYIAKIIE